MANRLEERKTINNNDYVCTSQHVQEIYSANDDLVEERPIREETPPTLLSSLTDDMFVVEAPSFVVPYLYERPPNKRWKKVFPPESVSEVIDLSSPQKVTNIHTDPYFASPLGSFFIELGQNLVAESMKHDKMGSLVTVWTLKGIIENLEGTVRVLKGTIESTKRTVDLESPVAALKEGVQALKGIVIPLARTVNSMEGISQTLKGFERPLQQKIDSFEQTVQGLKKAVVLLELLFEGLKRTFLALNGPAGSLEDILKALEESVGSFKGSIATLEETLGALKERGGNSPEEEDPIANLLMCQECDFKTESKLVMEHHLESPHSKGKLLICPRCPFTSKTTQVMDMLYHCLNSHSLQGRIMPPMAPLQCPACPFEATAPSKMAAHGQRCAAAQGLQQNLAPAEWEPPAKVQRQSLQKVIQYAQKKPAHSSHKKKPAPVHPLDLSCPVGPSYPVKPFSCPSPVLRRFVPRIPLPPHPAHPAPRPASRIPPPLLPIGSFVNRGYSASRGPLDPPRPFVPQNGKKKVTHTKAAFVICELCDGYIRDLDQLKLHLLVAHAVLTSPRKLPLFPPLFCQHCPLRFYTDNGLQRHLTTEHKVHASDLTRLASLAPVTPRKSVNISYCCIVCQARFSQYSLYMQHVEITHPHFFRKTR